MSAEEDKLIELIQDEIKLEHLKSGVKEGPIPLQGFQAAKDLDIFARFQRLQQKPEVKEMNELITRVNTLNQEAYAKSQTTSNNDAGNKKITMNVDSINNTQKKSTLPTSTPDEFKKLWAEFKLDDIKEAVVEGEDETGYHDYDDDLEDLLEEDDFLESFIEKL